MRKLTTEEFKAKAIEVYGTVYDYSKSVYINSRSKITIICKKHGEFTMTPNNHLRGQGCPVCNGSRLLTLDEFISKASKLHGGKYDYSLVNYVNMVTKVTIICPVHGAWEQTPGNHLSGHGCKICGEQVASNSKRYSTNQYINQANLIHNNKYDYGNTVYTNSKTKVTITCKVHGPFTQVASAHLKGQGCPSCAKHGFDSSKPGYLYYLKVTTDCANTLYKIGITNLSVNERFNLTDLLKIEVVKQKLFDKGSDALSLETKIKQQYKQYQYKGPNILESGNTELFIVDIDSLSPLFEEVP